jgi:hypothetical protein
MLCSLSGIAVFFLPTFLDRRMLSFFLRERGRELLKRTGNGTLLTAEISNTDKSRVKIAIDGDDYALIWADRTSHEIIIEGVAARYHICQEDVLGILPFKYMNHLGAEITYRIDSKTVLCIAIARVSYLLELTRQVPLLAPFRNRIKNKILQEINGSVGSAALDSTLINRIT